MISEVDLKDWDPQIQVTEIIENEDGSADCRLHANNHGMRLLIQMGFNAILRQALPKEEK